MKTFLQYATMFLIFFPLLFISTDNRPLTPQVNQNDLWDNTNDTQSIESSDWFSRVTETIKKEEYHITFAEGMNAYQSPNRSQNLRFIYATDGFTAKPRTTKIPLFDQSDRTLKEEEKQYQQIEDWQVQLKVIGYGRGVQLKGFKGKELTVYQNKAFIEDQGLKIEYENNEEGMRQNFIVKEKPEGNGLLKFKINAETPLTMRVGPDAVVFANPSSDEKMKYNSLKVWDAEYKILAAHFEKEKNSLFAIVVNDDNAVYPVTIDPLSTTADWTALGDQLSARYGCSVSTAGDVNGDGYSDVIVGAYWYDWVYSNEGRAYVYHGSASGLSTGANWIARSDQAEAWLGYSVATAGDVNGDGYSDIIVGTYHYDHGETDEGGAFVWYGSSTGLGISGLPSNADWAAEGNQSNARFGYSVSTAGDVNGDNYSDIVIGAPSIMNGAVAGGGKAFVYHGSSGGLSTTANWTAVSDNQSTGEFGISVSTAGDVNGDGYSDVIVGDDRNEIGQAVEGRVFVYHGSSSGLSANANWTAESNQVSALLGFSVSTAGDVNGDGYSDIIVGARSYDHGETDEGCAFVWHGSSTGLGASGTPTNADWLGESNQVDALMGVSVFTAGDLNGDGYGDIIIGAHAYDNGQLNEGRAYVYQGSSSGLSTNANWTAESNQEGAYFGTSVSTAGDVNGDGYSDVIVGASSYGGLHQGGAFVYHGSADGLPASVNWTAESNQVSALLGFSVSTAGDVNGDSFSDVIVGAIYYDGGQTDEGRAYVYHGASGGLSLTASWTAESNQASARFGSSVCTAGDVNGDGFGDVIIGAPYYDGTSLVDAGRAYVYHGSLTGLSATASWSDMNNQVSARYGVSVSTAGDVNGDGYSDVIVGADLYDNGQTNEGAAYVYYGTATGLSTSANWTAEGNVSGANYGGSVATAGDVNGDGFNDVIVGAYPYGNVQLDEGAAFVYYGSMGGLATTANWTMESNQASASFGYSVATAGDVNGDGFSDVIVGAPRYDNGQTDEGRAFVYHGSSSGISTTANWTAESNQASANFGYSVSTAGDVNGDGYSDVIVGAWNYDNPESNEGQAFVYYGSSSGLSSTADWTAEGNQVSAYFGCSVSSAGDVNGDGYSDVIVRAWGYDNVEVNEGRAFVYYGNNGGGLKCTPQQYIPATTIVVGPHGKTTFEGAVLFTGFAKSPFGRADGKLMYEYVENGSPFGTIANFSGQQVSYYDLGTPISGRILYQNALWIPSMKNYRWRERTKYRLSNNPYQVYGPWRYYTSYQPTSFGSFKPQDVPLPVELSSFKASVEKNQVCLNWVTETEVSNFGFEVERAVINLKSNKQNAKFCKIGFIQGHGNSNSPKNYSFIDEKPFGGSKFQYRLKQIDTDGQFEYSDIVEVEIVPYKFELYQNYPNPFNPNTTLKFQLPMESKVILKVYDILGAEVKTLLNDIKEPGVYEVVLEAENLPSGTYIYRIVAGEFVQTKKMLLLK